MPMVEINYKEMVLPIELLDSFAKAMVPEIRKFYASDAGKKYFKNWLKKHPEYNKNKSAYSTNKGERL